MFLARRGIEGINSFKKTDFELQVDDDGNKSYKLVCGGLTKNHQDDSEDLSMGGVIPFDTNDHGFNPGQFFHDYLNKLHKDSPYLLQRPRTLSGKFDIKSNPSCW